MRGAWLKARELLPRSGDARRWQGHQDLDLLLGWENQVQATQPLRPTGWLLLATSSLLDTQGGSRAPQ